MGLEYISTQDGKVTGQPNLCQAAGQTTGSRAIRLTLLRAVVAISAMALILYYQDLGALKATIGRIEPASLLLGIAAFLFGQVLLAVRWWVLLLGLEIRISLLVAIRLHMLGLFYNNLLPSSIGGDLLRAYYVARHTDRPMAAATSVFVDRLVGVGTMLLVVAGVCVWLRPDLKAIIGPANSRPAVGIWLIAGLSIATVLAGICLRFWPAIAHKIAAVTRKVLTTIKDCTRIYADRPYVILIAMTMTICLQWTIILSFWVLGRGMAITAGIRYYLLIFPLTWLFSAIPVSLAGIGLLEGGMVALFTHLAGVEQQKAFALALCQRLAWLVASLPGFVIHLSGSHRPKSN